MGLNRVRIAHPGITVLLCVSLVAGGCTRTYRARVSRYDLSGEAPLKPAPLTGVYTVQWTRTPGKHLRTMEGTQTLIPRGEEVGFEVQDDGTVVAIAGRKRIALDGLPGDARIVLWYHKSERQTQFGKEVGEAMETIVAATVIGAAVVGTAAIIGGVAYLESEHGDDRDDSWSGW